jgi:LuxR family transcriptional regulator, maltose regulon positive regulatory protein
MQRRFDHGHQPCEAATLRLVPPRRVSGIIRRERLLHRVSHDSSAPVVLIQAPAGHGKSVLMQQVQEDCERRQICTGWITLQESDDDVVRLIRILQTLLDQLCIAGEAGSRVLPEGDQNRSSGGMSRAEWVLGRLLALDRPVVLFIDEFQALGSASALTFFRDLLAGLPRHVRVVIGSRTLPQIGLSRLMVGEQVDVIKANELLFTFEEVESFFACLQVQLSRREIEAIYHRTEGWPAAVQLYRLSLANAEVRKSLADMDADAFQPRRLTEYLTDNVLSIHPHDVQRFFLDTSVLVRMSGPLCHAITGRSDSRELLTKLEDCGLFVRSLDSSLQWFQYHSLFSGFLKAQLHRASPAREQQIHAQAAQWFRENGYLEEALWHAVAMQDYPLAATCLQDWAAQLVMQGNLATIERWFERLPLEEVQRHPKLLVEIAWALAFMRRHERLARVLGLLDTLHEDPRSRNDQNVLRSMVCILKDDIVGAKAYAEACDPRHFRGADPFSVFEAGATAILKGHLALFAGELDLAHDHLVAGRACGKQVNAAFTVLGSLATAAMNLTVQGRLNEAVEILSDAPADACLTLDQSVASAAYAASYIHALYESNQWEAARSLFDRSFEVIAGAAQVDFLAIACVSMIRMYDATQCPARASALLDEVESIGHSGSLARLVRLIAWERVRRNILGGDLERARAIAGRITEDGAPVPPGWIAFSEDTEGSVINRIRLAVHDGKQLQACGMIEPELRAASKQGRVRRKCKLLLLNAMARHLDGNELAAFKSLREAVQLARPGGYVRTFLDEGRLAVDLIAEAYRKCVWSEERRESSAHSASADADFVRSLLRAAGVDCEVPTAPGQTSSAPGEPLSSRESEILDLLARGMFNREIGKRLFISENTVKFHLKNIYAKLGVKSRSQAINSLGSRRSA